jgi:hypothetical protein
MTSHVRTGLSLAATLFVAGTASAGETLYNGVVLPAAWPPRLARVTREPM